MAFRRSCQHVERGARSARCKRPYLPRHADLSNYRGPSPFRRDALRASLLEAMLVAGLWLSVVSERSQVVH
jgi:hypothetical protein